MSVRAGTSYDSLSFQRVVLPLIKVVTSEPVRNSPLMHHSTPMYSCCKSFKELQRENIKRNQLYERNCCPGCSPALTFSLSVALDGDTFNGFMVDAVRCVQDLLEQATVEDLFYKAPERQRDEQHGEVWTPTGFLDVFEPMILLMQELFSRTRNGIFISNNITLFAVLEHDMTE